MKLEKEFTALMKASLIKAGVQYIHKNHGSRFMATGRPDLEGLAFGRFFGIEMKRSKKELVDPRPDSGISLLQMEDLWRIAKGGGTALAVCLDEEPWREQGRKVYRVIFADVSAMWRDEAGWKPITPQDACGDPPTIKLKAHLLENFLRSAPLGRFAYHIDSLEELL